MSNRVNLQAAFVLHHKPFRDTSVIAELLTPDYGRVSVIARGARSAKSPRRVLLQPFRPLLASWVGRAELHTLTTLEESGLPIALNGGPLACAYYVTELMLRLIPRDESNVQNFALYAHTLDALASIENDTGPVGTGSVGTGSVGVQTSTIQTSSNQADASSEICLRKFEIGLLHNLGLLPDFASCDKDHGAIEAHIDYQFHPATGSATRSCSVSDCVAVNGATLLAMAKRSFTGAELQLPLVLLQAKRLMRRILQLHIGSQPLQSREVFRQLKALSSSTAKDQPNDK